MTAVANYGRIDRLVHRLAFARPAVQLAAADIEESIFGRNLAGVPIDRPIFVTSLPRAGTTVLLTALARMPSLATHTYRDMPFVMAPLFWSRVSGRFRKSGTRAARAHGDGLTVGYDSPEAFEEVIWRTFWPRNYLGGAIAPWSAADRNPEGEAFLRRNMQKIILLRCGAAAGSGRYLSKNNANIARLPLIREVFPGARIIVPVREPLEHAELLRCQHVNFLAQQAETPFVRRYMEDIGHFEFGALHRPIAFPGFRDISQGLDPLEIDYWLAYWIAAFAHIASVDTRFFLVSNEQLREGRPGVLQKLFDWIGLEPGAHLQEIAGEFRPGAPLARELRTNQTLRDQAEELHEALLASAGVVGRESI